MREIKFRVWDGSQWSYFKIGQTWGSWMESVYTDHCLNGRTFYQFTGLKDKNGREIYEGDVVVEEIETGKYKPFVVKWHNDYAGFDMSSSPCWTILGNIYENPELL